jgi:hypothetical protein
LTQSEANGLEAAYRKTHPNDKGLIPGLASLTRSPMRTVGKNCRNNFKLRHYRVRSAWRSTRAMGYRQR